MQKSPSITVVPSAEQIRAVSPALEHYMIRLQGDLWKRPDLSPRDRSIVTVAVLIARNQTLQMRYYFNLALDNGVKPGELSEIITHLAFYSGYQVCWLLCTGLLARFTLCDSGGHKSLSPRRHVLKTWSKYKQPVSPSRDGNIGLSRWRLQEQ
jgi:alkylhydroperoxidase/carboxymuconolactone decarboxylase family protein YurZ